MKDTQFVGKCMPETGLSSGHASQGRDSSLLFSLLTAENGSLVTAPSATKQGSEEILL